MARIDMFRRFTRFLRNTKEFPGVLRFAGPMLGLGGSDLAMAPRYRQLSACAPGTLGPSPPVARTTTGPHAPRSVT